MAKIIKNNLFWKICWLIGFDFIFIILNIYLGIYFIGAEKLRGSNNLPLIYEISWWFPFLIAPIYFIIWHRWRDIFIKSIFLFLSSIVIFDTQIMSISEFFSYKTFELVFSEKGLEIYIILLILMVITYNISVIFFKFIKYINDKKIFSKVKSND